MKKKARWWMKICKYALLAIIAELVFCGLANSAPPLRIVSLAPSITEILYDLGVGERIVAVTVFCDYPALARSKLKIGGYANPSLEAIISAKPDLVVLAEDGNPTDMARRLKKIKIRTHVFRARRLWELPGGIIELGKALEIEKTAVRRAREIEEELNRYAQKARFSSLRRPKRKALFVIHPEPLLVAGRNTVIDDVLTLLDMENIAADSGASYVKFTLEEVISRSPDVIFFGQGPMSRNLSASLLRRLKSLEAVQKGHVHHTSELLYRLTPRTLLGIEELVNCLNKR